ncbi:hypothetical protein GCM10011490_28740 [Pseudoclavibacter endophyticus]|nr:hypothetical protein [Pseudoclavibacter endophyticus]GGA76207.1 hypothetical protein GCM10011490_28740 [Pseudoclavibacter endophyticus]
MQVSTEPLYEVAHMLSKQGPVKRTALERVAPSGIGRMPLSIVLE